MNTLLLFYVINIFFLSIDYFLSMDSVPPAQVRGGWPVRAGVRVHLQPRAEHLRRPRDTSHRDKVGVVLDCIHIHYSLYKYINDIIFC